MKKNNMKKFSNGLFALGVIVAIIGFYRIAQVRMTLPPGVCPIDNQRGFYFGSIGLFLASFITDIIADKKEHLNKEDLHQ